MQRSADRHAPAVLAVALVLFAALCAAFPSVWRGGAKISDVHVYQRYGDAIERGEVPYRDFRPEYPPGALVVFALPSLVSHTPLGYSRTFAFELGTLGLLGIAACFHALRSLGAGAGRLVGGLALPATAPLLVGPLVLTRFDLWPAAIVAAALAALLAGRDRLGAGLLGLGVAVKLYPGVLVPLAIAWTWRRRGPREALLGLAACLAVIALIVVPFVVIAPDGFAWSIHRQLDRPLQIESLGAAVLLGLHHAAGLPLGWSSSSGSQNLTGTVAVVAATITTLAQVAMLLWVWLRFARDPRPSAETLAVAAATSLVAFVGLGKVLSPQFLVWPLAVVALQWGRRGWLALPLLAVACGLTRAWFPDRYWRLVFTFDPLSSWLVLARDLVLLGLLVLLVVELRERSARPRSP